MARLIGALSGVVFANAGFICTHAPPVWSRDFGPTECVCLTMDPESLYFMVFRPSQNPGFNFTVGGDKKHLRTHVDDMAMCVTHPANFQMQPCAQAGLEDSQDFFDFVPSNDSDNNLSMDTFHLVHRRSNTCLVPNADADSDSSPEYPLLTDCDHPSVEAPYLEWFVASVPMCINLQAPQDELV